MSRLISPTALEQAVDSNAVVLVYADWCGHCRTFKPIFEEVAQELKRGALPRAHFCKMDWPKHEAEVQKSAIGKGTHFAEGIHEAIKEFPTTLLFRRGEDRVPLPHEVYDGGADRDALKGAIEAFFAA